MSLITLITDFGSCDGYVGVMKGVIAQVAAGIKVVDLTHRIPPQDVMAARFNLLNSHRYFPVGTVHCVVVDPGVGTARRAVAVAAEVDGQPQQFVAPDNGVLDGILSHAGQAVVLSNPHYWRTATPSQTFHGRDIFAPVAAHLANGVPLSQMGETVAISTLARLPMAVATLLPQGCQGAVQYLDHFGNAVTNIPAIWVTAKRWQLECRGQQIAAYTTYGDAPVGQLLGLIGSHSWVEIAVNGGHAAHRLGLQVGDGVTVSWL